MVFSHHWIDISGEKSYWWWGGVVACRIILSAPVPFLFLWSFNFEFRTWNWDLDLGLGFGTGLGLDNISLLYLFWFEYWFELNINIIVWFLKIWKETKKNLVYVTFVWIFNSDYWKKYIIANQKYIYLNAE